MGSVLSKRHIACAIAAVLASVAAACGGGQDDGVRVEPDTRQTGATTDTSAVVEAASEEPAGA